MGILTSIVHTHTYTFRPEEIAKLVAADLEVDVKDVEVKFNIREVGVDPFDRFPGTPKVVSIDVTVKK